LLRRLHVPRHAWTGIRILLRGWFGRGRCQKDHPVNTQPRIELLRD
jgi:hypothetical protein